MCGIAGIFRRRGDDESDPRRLGAMTDALVHRGPDDHGYLLLDSNDGSFTLGQDILRAGRCDLLLGSRRLAIIDTSPAGRQPMTNETRDLFLVFNGEIYNYRELGRDLRARGHRFSSDSDTEVIVHAYEEWGPGCVARFNGMWAFALWDQRRRVLFCSRDRFSVKPFYYYIDENVFILASEIKAILSALPQRPSPDWGSIHAFLTRNALCHTDKTLLEGIKRLPPAHNLFVASDRLELTPYWDCDSPSEAYDYSRPRENFAELLDDSVRLRLRSDVPVGISLSGGMDSSSIAALARRHIGAGALKVFTAAFPGTRHDERHYAELVARRFGAEFHVAEYRPKSLIEDLRRVIRHMDQPAPISQVLPRWHLMGLAAEHVKVLLEGQGSDEMLAGYPSRYFRPWIYDELDHLISRNFVRSSARLAAVAVEKFRRSEVNPLQAISRRVFRILKRRLRARAAGHRALTPAFRELGRRFNEGLPPGQRHGARLTNALLNDHGRDILPCLLMFGDAISMGHSVEARLPFLDYRLVEFVFGLPTQWKYDGIETKIVLKRAMKDALPAEILARKDKIGFATPIDRWIENFLDSEVRPLLLSSRARSRGIFESAEIEKTLVRFAAGNHAASSLIFRWLSLEIWFQIYIDGAAPLDFARSSV
jgi:asparagine synthase (glutamine-hydrolysing)